MKVSKRVSLGISCIMVGLLSGLFLFRMWGGDTVSARDESYEGLKVFTEVLSAVQKNYVDVTKNQDLLNGAIHGMVATLDPYSSYMDPDDYKDSQIDTKGEFGGLGLQVGMREKQVVVISPIDGTPAMRAGILAGDVIVKVDDKAWEEGGSIQDAVHKMRGPSGTKVTLTIRRKEQADLLTIELIREIIQVHSVISKVIDGEIGYIRLTQFQERTANDLARALSKFQETGVHSLVLDLRNNPGGLLTASVEVSEQFLENGKLVVSVKGRNGVQNDFVGQGSGEWKDAPMVILVNKGSASASEIVSGAMQDWGRAVILGAQTFGKGSVQTILPLSDGSALRLTTAKYYTPKGRSIADVGVSPDITVNEREGSDVSKEKDPSSGQGNHSKAGSEIKAGEDTPAVKQNSQVDEEKEKKDIPLQKAVDLLKSFKIFKGVNAGANLQLLK